MTQSVLQARKLKQDTRRCYFGLTHRNNFFLCEEGPPFKTFLVRFDMAPKRRRTGPTEPTVSVAKQPAGNPPHQAGLDEVARMLQEADARHTEHINQVAASVAEQLKTFLPPPALPTDGDMEEDETTDERAGGPTPTPAEATCLFMLW